MALQVGVFGAGRAMGTGRGETGRGGTGSQMGDSSETHSRSRRARPEVALRAVRPKRLYQQIAEQIHELMQTKQLRPGDRLPSEPQLARQLGVSRPSVREAMIVLETAGLIEVQSGSGTYVREPPADAGRLSWLTTADPGPSPLEQFQARMLLECELAAEAARHITDEEIAALEVIVERIERNVEETGRVNRDHFLFHEKLAEASRNSVLATFLRELIAMNQGPMWMTMRSRIDTAENLRKGIEVRRRLLDCLRRRDSRGAKALMRHHVCRIGRLYFGDAVTSAISRGSGHNREKPAPDSTGG